MSSPARAADAVLPASAAPNRSSGVSTGFCHSCSASCCAGHRSGPSRYSGPAGAPRSSSNATWCPGVRSRSALPRSRVSSPLMRPVAPRARAPAALPPHGATRPPRSPRATSAPPQSRRRGLSRGGGASIEAAGRAGRDSLRCTPLACSSVRRRRRAGRGGGLRCTPLVCNSVRHREPPGLHQHGAVG